MCFNVQGIVLVLDEKPVELLNHELYVLLLQFRCASVYLSTGKASTKSRLIFLALHLLDVVGQKIAYFFGNEVFLLF